jgi:DNA repair ATPase RecN
LLRDANLKVAEVTDLLKELEQQYEILSDPSIKNETIAQIFMLSASELSNRNNRLDNIHDLVRKFNENGLAAQVQPLDGVSKQLDLGTKNDIQMNKPWGVAKMLP